MSYRDSQSLSLQQRREQASMARAERARRFHAQATERWRAANRTNERRRNTMVYRRDLFPPGEVEVEYDTNEMIDAIVQDLRGEVRYYEQLTRRGRRGANVDVVNNERMIQAWEGLREKIVFQKVKVHDGFAKRGGMTIRLTDFEHPFTTQELQTIVFYLANLHNIGRLITGEQERRASTFLLRIGVVFIATHDASGNVDDTEVRNIYLPAKWLYNGENGRFNFVFSSDFQMFFSSYGDPNVQIMQLPPIESIVTISILSAQKKDAQHMKITHPGSGNFIPLVIAEGWEWTSDFWERFQIFPSIISEKYSQVEKDEWKRKRMISCIKNAIDPEDKENWGSSIIGCGYGPTLDELLNYCRFKNIEVNVIHYRLTDDEGNWKYKHKNKTVSETAINIDQIRIYDDYHYIRSQSYRYNDKFFDTLDAIHAQYPRLTLSEIMDCSEGRLVSSPFIIFKAVEKGILKEMSFDEEVMFPPAVLTGKTIEHYVPMDNRKFVTVKVKPPTQQKILFADFEAMTSGQHKAYCVCCSDGKETYSWYGEDCAERFLDWAFAQAPCILYFHNMKYDIGFILRYVHIMDRVIKDSKVYRVMVTRDKATFEAYKIHNAVPKGKETMVLDIRDTYTLIPMALRLFPKSFGLKVGVKEVFPYNAITRERLYKCPIKCWEDEKPEWSEERKREFVENLERLNCIIDGECWDVKKYTLFYCRRDVEILKDGFNVFRDQIMQEFGIDITTKLSISSIANTVFCLNVYNHIDELNQVHGTTADFIRESCYGGRCMVRDNECCEVEGNIVDYDAVSLYPSAMARMFIPCGPCEYMNESLDYYINHLMPVDQEHPSLDKFISFFVVRIHIKHALPKQAFPLIARRSLTLEYKDGANCDVEMVVNSIMLEDMINTYTEKFEFHEATHSGRGLYWYGYKDFKIREYIKKVFNKRKELKAQKNPTETCYKLLMNSAYGKTIQKPVFNIEKFFMSEEDMIRVLRGRWRSFISATSIGDKTWIAKLRKNILMLEASNWNLAHVGSIVLAMSKRIMNEVFQCATDLHIFYQDTDSLHIAKNELHLLEERFRIKYGRELCGTEMGQFHVDYPPVDGKEVLHGRRSLFLSKKVYCTELENKEGATGWYYRMKGVSPNAIEGEAAKKGTDIWGIYTTLYRPGGSWRFDMAKYGPSFKFVQDGPMITNEEFPRELSIDGERWKYRFENGRWVKERRQLSYDCVILN